jgi:hypothetical protein
LEELTGTAGELCFLWRATKYCLMC